MKELIDWMSRLSETPVLPAVETFKGPKGKKLKSPTDGFEDGKKIKSVKRADKAAPKVKLKEVFIPEAVPEAVPEGEARLPGISPGLKLIGINDITGDGNPDYLYWNPQTRELFVSAIDPAGKRYNFNIALSASALDWEPVGLANMSNQGTAPNSADIVWRQTSGAGLIGVWRSNPVSGGFAVSDAYALNTPLADQNWQIQAVADVNGDGRGDLIWRNIATGETAVWVLNEATLVSGYYLPTVPIDWKIAGAADFNGNGVPDLFWRRTSGAGETAVWLMSPGFTTFSGVYSTAVSDQTWQATAAGRVGGQPVVAWKGADYTPRYGNAFWLMNGSTITGISSAPANISAAGFEFVNPDYSKACGFGVVNFSRSVAVLLGQPVLQEIFNMTNSLASEQVKAQETIAANYQGQGVIVAICDDGIDFNLPTLAGKQWVNPNSAEVRPNGFDFVNNNNTNFVSGQTHGTNTAEIVVKSAPGVKLMNIRSINPNNSVNVDAMASGIRWAVDRGARVLHLSFYVPFNAAAAPGYIPAGCANINNAINYAINAGATVILSAGNNPTDIDVSYPGHLASNAGAISVTAVMRFGQFVTAFGRAGSNLRNVVAAPTLIPTTYSAEGFYGTSASMPTVTALAAILKGAKPSASSTELKNAIIGGATVDNFWI